MRDPPERSRFETLRRLVPTRLCLTPQLRSPQGPQIRNQPVHEDKGALSTVGPSRVPRHLAAIVYCTATTIIAVQSTGCLHLATGVQKRMARVTQIGTLCESR